MQEAPRTGVNASHFGVQVGSTEDVTVAWSRFKQAGLETFTEENTACCYAMQDKVWIRDPDGNHWEVFARTPRPMCNRQRSFRGRARRRPR
ncbi:VOC family protein [Pendulispora albinea]|uniref:VOC family protein n=1 Tax=Pendulispora albinea TaxID=2741071 RepID=A0ABZ2MCH7_9BACT